MKTIRSYLSPILVGSFSLFLLVIPLKVRAQDLVLKIEHGRMDAVVQGESLQQVMQRISKETGIITFVDQSLLSRPLSVRFQGLSVEEGLKKIVGDQSYVMVFSAKRDEMGNHPVRAIRIYPKGRPDRGRYVLLNAVDPGGLKGGSPVVMSREEVDALLKRNEQITLSNVAQRINERRNGKRPGNTPGQRSIVGKALQRARKIRELKELKAGTLARRKAFEAMRTARFRQERAARARTAFARGREAAEKSGLSRDFIN